MSLRREDVELVKEQCYQLLRRIDSLPFSRIDSKFYKSGRECAAVKRTSMELSHSLAAMRQPWRVAK